LTLPIQTEPPATDQSEAKRHLDEHGYVVLKQVLSREKVAAILERLEYLYEREGPRAGEFGQSLVRERYLETSPIKLRLLDCVYRMVEFGVFGLARVVPLAKLALRTFRSAPFDYSKASSFKRELRQMVICAVEKMDEPSDWRLCDLVNKGEVFDDVYIQPRVLDLVEHLLGSDFKLSSLNVRSPQKNGPMQGMHIDLPFLARRGQYYACNTLFALDDMDASNGATRVIPGTHTSGEDPQSVLADVRVDHPDQIVIEAEAGDVLIVNGNVWHGGTVNTSGKRRALIQCYYTHPAQPPQQYQELQLRDEVRARLSPLALGLLNAD
jgi:ectoine hydroxylase-related dioxygenase (phytanoyl-CoA dioxygenase family)